MASLFEFVIFLFIYPISATNGSAHQGLLVDSAPVLPLKETLQNVWQHVQDEGRGALNFAAHQRTWCSQILHWVEAVNARSVEFEILQLEADEKDAAVEVLVASTGQTKADIALVQHTIKEVTRLMDGRSATDAQSQNLHTLVSGRKHMLASLQSEIEVLVPLTKRLEADADELHHRIGARRASVKVLGGFASTLQKICDTGTALDKVRASLRLRVGTALQDALQALELVGVSAAATGKPSKLGAETLVGGSAEAGSAQQAFEVIEQDGDDEDYEDVALDLWQNDIGDRSFVEFASRLAPVADAAHGAMVDVAVDNEGAHTVEDRFGTVWSLEHEQWCLRESTHNKYALIFQQDMLAQTCTEGQLHSTASDQCDQDIAKIRDEMATIDNFSTTAAHLVEKQANLTVTAAKNRDLASKILAQAIAVLTRLRGPGGSLRTDAAAARAAQALQTASRELADAGNEGASGDDDGRSLLHHLSGAAEAANRSLARELAHLTRARKRHEFQRTLCEQRRAQYKSQAQATSTFLQHLQDECGGTSALPAQRMHEMEGRALVDAQRALQGDRVVRNSGRSARRVLRSSGESSQITFPSDSSVPQPVVLSPLQRAAVEMGVALGP